MAGRPRKTLSERVRDRAFTAKLHRDLLDGALVADPTLREIQASYQRNRDDLALQRKLSRDFERAVEQLPEVSLLEEIRALNFADFAERFLRHPKGHTPGQPFKLEPWQRSFTDEFGLLDADGRRVYGTGFLGLPRGCGKTALAAGIAVRELLCRTGEPDVFFAASSKQQAAIAFGFAKGFVRGSDALSQLVVVQKDELLVPETGGTMTVLPATGATAYGLAPDVTVADELHAWRQDAQLELWEALRTGAQKAPDGFVLAISTAPGKPDSLLAALLEHELGKPAVERPHDSLAIGRDRVAGTLTWWYGAPADADLDDEALWRRCNPASFVSIRDLRRQRLAPGISDGAFAKLHLNRAGADADDQLISSEAWARCRDDGLQPPAGASVTVGVESSYGGTTAAVAVLWRAPDGRIAIHVTVFATSSEPTAAHRRAPEWRRRIDLKEVEQVLAEIAQRFQVRVVAFDTDVVRVDTAELRRLGLSVERVESGLTRQRESSRRLFALISNAEIAHDGDAVLTAHILATRGIWDSHERLNVYRREQTRHVDGWYAAANALVALPESETVYSTRGMIIIDSEPETVRFVDGEPVASTR